MTEYIDLPESDGIASVRSLERTHRARAVRECGEVLNRAFLVVARVLDETRAYAGVIEI